MEKMMLASMDIVGKKREALKRIFPEVFTEERIDFDHLKRVLGEWVDSDVERFGLNWPGKAECMKIIQKPSIATLKPVRDESVNFDETENVFIEGENLEVLKLLQKAYFGKVKMIYIDPPYNTGKEFIYPDKYCEELKTYLAYTGQVDDNGRKFSTNTDTDGRFHSRWLNMMYPRLYLAYNLLREDGVIFISIDDNEVVNLRALCDLIFGEENFVAGFPRVTKKAGKSTDQVAKNNDFVVCYRKSEDLCINSYLHTDAGYKYSDEYYAERGKYKLNQTLDYSSIQYSPALDYEIEIDGMILRPGNVSAAEMEERKKRNPKSDFCWRWSKDLYEFGLNNGFVVLKKGKDEYRIYTKTYEKVTIDSGAGGYFIQEKERTKSATTLDFIENRFSNDNSRKDITRIFGKKVFEYSKPVSLIKELIFLGTNKNDIILDFFAGSATTAQAAMQLNAEDGGNRKFILVQLPESTTERTEAYNAGYKTIADIGKERIRRAAKQIEDEQNGQLDLNGNGMMDLGFKAFKLDQSNFRVWDGTVEDEDSLAEQLELHVDHISEESNAEDILYEILLKAGFPLTTKVEKRNMAGKEVFSIADGEVLICLEQEVTSELIDALASANSSQVICLDAAFQRNDQLKVNAALTFKFQAEARGTEMVFKTV